MHRFALCVTMNSIGWWMEWAVVSAGRATLSLRTVARTVCWGVRVAGTVKVARYAMRLVIGSKRTITYAHVVTGSSLSS